MLWLAEIQSQAPLAGLEGLVIRIDSRQFD